MKTLQFYEKGEHVGIEMIITNVALENGEAVYKLKDPISLKEYPHTFKNDELYEIPVREKEGEAWEAGLKES